MSTLSEHTGKGNPTATGLPGEDAKAQMDGILQHFDILPSKWERIIFRYLYAFIIGIYVLSEFLLLPLVFLQSTSSLQVGEILLLSGLALFLAVIIICVVWSFIVWRLRTPKTLRDLLEKKRIYLPDGDATASYLCCLANYRDALASPKRYCIGYLGHPFVKEAS